VAAGRALESLGIEARHIATGGGSDANVLTVRGLPCLNVANGTERNHEPGERVTVAALETGLDVALAIVAHAEPL
jgi:tripeptide aminopeptidase